MCTRNQRVRRGRTDWYAFKRKLSRIVVCSPKLNANAAEGPAVSNGYFGPDSERVLESEKVMEGLIRLWEKTGVSSGLLQTWIELQKAAM